MTSPCDRAHLCQTEIRANPRSVCSKANLHTQDTPAGSIVEAACRHHVPLICSLFDNRCADGFRGVGQHSGGTMRFILLQPPLRSTSKRSQSRLSSRPEYGCGSQGNEWGGDGGDESL